MPPFPPQYPFPWYADAGDGTWTFFSDVPLPKSSKRNSTTRTGTGTALNPATIFNGTPHSISQSIRFYRFDVDDRARALQDYKAGIANPAKGFPPLGSVTDVLENCGESALVKQTWDPEHGNVRGSNVSLNSHFLISQSSQVGDRLDYPCQVIFRIVSGQQCLLRRSVGNTALGVSELSYTPLLSSWLTTCRAWTCSIHRAMVWSSPKTPWTAGMCWCVRFGHAQKKYMYKC